MLLGAIPAAVWGVEGAVEKNLKVIDTVIAPGATGEGDQTRAACSQCLTVPGRSAVLGRGLLRVRAP